MSTWRQSERPSPGQPHLKCCYFQCLNMRATNIYIVCNCTLPSRGYTLILLFYMIAYWHKTGKKMLQLLITLMPKPSNSKFIERLFKEFLHAVDDLHVDIAKYTFTPIVCLFTGSTSCQMMSSWRFCLRPKIPRLCNRTCANALRISRWFVPAGCLFIITASV